MPHPNNRLPIGLLLQNAGLISNEQVETALQTQKQYTKMKLGEILVLQEGIKAKTIDFFVNKWHTVVSQGKQFPLGYYFKKAYLLNEQQIETILQEQQKGQKFGSLAVQKGWLKPKTVDFFINSLSLKPPQIITLSTLEEYNNNNWHLERKYADCSLILSRTLAWTGGNIHLTKSICQVFADSDINIAAGSEVKAVDMFVEGTLIKKWRVSKAADYIRLVKQNLVNNPRCISKLLLEEYQEILLLGNKNYQNTKEQNELLLLGLLSYKNDRLFVANIIYQRVFNRDFIAEELNKIEPVANSNNLNFPNNNTSAPPVPITPEIPPNSNHVQIEVNHQRQTNANDSKPNISKPLIVAGSVITLGAIALLIPLLININNYYSSNSKSEPANTEPANLEPANLEPKPADLDFALKVNKLEQFCDGIDSIDPNSSLTLISRLEKNQQLLEAFPDSCQIALDRLRITAAPKLGQQSRILEAVKHLCKIPGDSPMHLEAEVWIRHWSESPDWGEKTRLYLDNFAKYKNFECPAAHSILES